MYIRARYGHGARLDYEKEWRMKRKISGGEINRSRITFN